MARGNLGAALAFGRTVITCVRAQGALMDGQNPEEPDLRLVALICFAVAVAALISFVVL